MCDWLWIVSSYLWALCVSAMRMISPVWTSLCVPFHSCRDCRCCRCSDFHSHTCIDPTSCCKPWPGLSSLHLRQYACPLPDIAPDRLALVFRAQLDACQMCTIVAWLVRLVSSLFCLQLIFWFFIGINISWSMFCKSRSSTIPGHFDNLSLRNRLGLGWDFKFKLRFGSSCSAPCWLSSRLRQSEILMPSFTKRYIHCKTRLFFSPEAKKDESRKVTWQYQSTLSWPG